MAFDASLAARLRAQLTPLPGLAEKKMFGGLGFLLNGNMCCGVHGPDLIVRVDPQETAAALARPHTRVFDLTGRPMKGWVLVQPAGIANDAELAAWVEEGVAFASSLPPK